MSKTLDELRADIAEAQAMVKAARNRFNVDPSAKEDLDLALELLADAKATMARSLQ